MLTKLILKNFRKFEDSEMDFKNGLNVIRGQNEQGKSTVIESMLYALYGAKALRNSLDDTVTWGKPVNTLKVVAHFNFNGTLYVFHRSKAGAEVYKGNGTSPFVTGQTEVTSFATSLIGADAVTANKLMLASQGNLRGALELGPKATAEMVEGLSDFSFFETLLEGMQQKLVLGSDVSAKTRLDQAKATLDELHFESTVNPNDLVVLRAQLEQQKPQTKSAEEAYNKAKLALEVVNTHKEQRKKAQDDLEKAKEKLEQQEALLSDVQKQIYKVDTSSLDSLRQRIQQEASLKTLFTAYQAFNKFKEKAHQGDVWEGSLESLDFDIETTLQVLNNINDQIKDSQAMINDKKSRIITTTTCNHCGQPIKNLDAVLKNNEILEGEVEALETNLKSFKHEASEYQATLNAYQAVRKANQPTELFLRTHAEYVTVDYEQVPFVVEWKGAIPQEGEDVQALQKQVDDIERQVKAVELATTKLQLLNESLSQYEEAVETARAYLNSLPEVKNASQTQEAFEAAEMDYLQATNQLGVLEHHVSECEQALKMEEVKRQAFENQKTQLENQVKQYEQEVKDLAFNNALLKKVRDARPIVANQLWSLVLSSVSTMFSKVRGVASQVTKDRDGFKVNGQAVASLSGSTLDLLGLSIRCSLIKLFIPNCPFLVLDEPAAAMDVDRTAHMMGFVQSNAFDQVILITHEDMSEMLADNLIEI